jgi:hypothetical protein
LGEEIHGHLGAAGVDERKEVSMKKRKFNYVIQSRNFARWRRGTLSNLWITLVLSHAAPKSNGAWRSP